MQDEVARDVASTVAGKLTEGVRRRGKRDTASTGRPRDGLQWMIEREPLWSSDLNVSRVHIWWHKALFHMELGDNDQALAIYDGPILAT